jgi:2-dehydro-3-deoxy-D-gluconate 5-dehydrogenase
MNQNYFDLVGRKALVCGGAGDLGSAIVLALYESGAEAAVLDCIPDMDEWIAERRSGQGPLLAGIRVDLTDRADLVRGFQQAVEALGGLDILVNCQSNQRRYPDEDFPLETWDQVLEINLTSVFEISQLAGRKMLKNGHGKIINIASMQSFNGGINIPAYAASKVGVAILTKSLCNAWASRGINVNAIAPGYFDTKMTAALKADPVRYQQILTRIPAGRWGIPDDIKGPLLFLASSASDYLNGVILPVDGGMLSI